MSDIPQNMIDTSEPLEVGMYDFGCDQINNVKAGIAAAVRAGIKGNDLTSSDIKKMIESSFTTRLETEDIEAWLNDGGIERLNLFMLIGLAAAIGIALSVDVLVVGNFTPEGQATQPNISGLIIPGQDKNLTTAQRIIKGTQR